MFLVFCRIATVKFFALGIIAFSHIIPAFHVTTRVRTHRRLCIIHSARTSVHIPVLFHVPVHFRCHVVVRRLLIATTVCSASFRCKSSICIPVMIVKLPPISITVKHFHYIFCIKFLHGFCQLPIVHSFCQIFHHVYDLSHLSSINIFDSGIKLLLGTFSQLFNHAIHSLNIHSFYASLVTTILALATLIACVLVFSTAIFTQQPAGTST